MRASESWVSALTLLLCLIWALPAGAQNPVNRVVIYGSVRDAVSGEPVGGAVVTADSSALVTADSTGSFAIVLGRDPPYLVSAERFGYAPTTFELPRDAPSRLVVLLLDPAPVEIEGLGVVGGSIDSEVVAALERRRGSYPGSVITYDQDRLASVPAYDALGLVLLRAPGVQFCPPVGFSVGGDALCRRVRRVRPATSFQGEPDPEFAEVLICVDGMAAGLSQLAAIPIERIVLFESFGQRMPGVFDLSPTVGHIHIYTSEWFTSAWAELSANVPMTWGC